MSEHESLEQQAAAWVPPWARNPDPTEESTTPSGERKGTFLTDSVEEGHPLNGEPEPPQAGDADAAAEPDVVDAFAADSVECGPDDLAGPLDEPGTADPDGPAPASAEPDGESDPVIASDATDEPAAQAADELADAAGDADEPVHTADADDEVVEPGEPVEPAVEVADTAADDLDGQASAEVLETAAVEETADVAADEVAAQDAAVEELAEALGEVDEERFDVDGLEDSGEAAVAVAASQLATPPPGLDADELIPALEAILLVVDEPVSEITLAEVLEVPAELIAGTLIDLSAAYTRQNRGFDLRRAAGGWRLYTRAAYAPYVERFVLDGQQLRLTQASLETLAVVAYKQPVTRSRISAIRGVNCDGVIRTLVTRGMIEECGTEPESGAHLYRTTSLFLEKLGLDSVDQLPPLAPFLPDNIEEIADEQR